MTELPLYFIAIVPPEPIYTFALRQKEYFREKYSSKAALKSPPHITLHMPFRLKEAKQELLVQSLEHLTHDHYCFELKINRFGAFEPRVIYLNINKPDPLVYLQKEIRRTMKSKLNLYNANYKDQVFNPHMTVAFRDLKKPMFYKAWEEFNDKEYMATFVVDSFALLKHDGKQWQVCETFHLKVPPNANT